MEFLDWIKDEIIDFFKWVRRRMMCLWYGHLPFKCDGGGEQCICCGKRTKK